jgi:mono/diheme cytochrome c family protein
MISDRTFNLAFFVCVAMFATVWIVSLSSCGPSGNQPNVEIIQDMMVQPALKAQDADPFTGHTGQRLPPEGTAPSNREVYLYKGAPELAEKNLVNPYANPSPETLALGKKNYDNYCFVCHGPTGHGDGPVGQKFQGIHPPPLISDKVRAYKDGRIFAIITEGTGVMRMYANQMPFFKDRWAVVAYVQALQLSQHVELDALSAHDRSEASRWLK